jgi:hypothetical protein
VGAVGVSLVVIAVAVVLVKPHMLRGVDGRRCVVRGATQEQQDSELIKDICRRCYPVDLQPAEPRLLVIFKIDKELPLVGAGDSK